MRQNVASPDYSNAGVARDATFVASRLRANTSANNGLGSSSGTSAEHYSASVEFAAGETVARVTVSNPVAIEDESSIVGTIARDDIAEVDDNGLLYVANVARVGSGSFDLVVVRCDYGMMDASEWATAETVSFKYTVGTPL